MSTVTSYEALVNLRQSYVDILTQDALNGSPPTHTIDGISIDANTWRKNLLQQITDINNILSQLNPMEDHSIII